MIRITSLGEKKQPSFAVFRAKHSLRRFTPALRDGGPFSFLSTGAEAPAYYQSASPRRRRFYLPAIHPASRVPVVSVLKTLNRNQEAALRRKIGFKQTGGVVSSVDWV